MNNQTPTKFYINNDVSTVYWMEGDALAFSPMMKNGTFSIEDGGIVEEEMFQDEHVFAPETENLLTLGDVFTMAREALQ